MKRIYYLLPIAGLLSLPTQMLAQKQTGSETILVNDSITLNLPEVFVKAERPLVKVADGKLQYDIPNLMKSKPVDNAFDILGNCREWVRTATISPCSVPRKPPSSSTAGKVR